MTYDLVKTSRPVRIAYVAHPVSASTAEGIAANLARAKRWLGWLWRAEPNIALCAPWIPLCEIADDGDPAARTRGLRDDCAMVARCDGIVLCGGKISGGMYAELTVAKKLSLIVWDLTHLGDEPPEFVPEVGALGLAAMYAPPQISADSTR